MWNVLIAEDDFKCRQGLVDALKGHGEHVAVATGDDALKAYQQSVQSQKPFDFIILDVSMPGLDGFEVLQAVRAEEDRGKIKPAKVIMITTYKDSLMENYNMGWDDFITKPVESEILINHMTALSDSDLP